MQLPGESRKRLLEVAQRLFGERGYGGTALQAIADELGLTKASVYYHFPAKSDLLAALAEPYLRGLDAILADAFDPSSPASCRWLLDAYLTALAEFPVVAAMLIGDPTSLPHPAAARSRALRLNLRDRLALAGTPPAGVVRATCCLGAVQSAIFDFSPAETAASRSTILDTAMRALGDPPDGA